MFVKIANRFTCEIFVEKDGEKVNGKSINDGDVCSCRSAASHRHDALAVYFLTVLLDKYSQVNRLAIFTNIAAGRA